MSLVGPHQRENAVNALRVMEFIRCGRVRDPKIPTAATAGVRSRTAPCASGWRTRRLPGVSRRCCPAPRTGMDRRGCDEGAVVEVHRRRVRDRRRRRAHRRVRAGVLRDGRRNLPGRPLAVVVAMASDKDRAGFLMEVIKAKPEVIVLTTVPIAGDGTFHVDLRAQGGVGFLRREGEGRGGVREEEGGREGGPNCSIRGRRGGFWGRPISRGRFPPLLGLRKGAMGRGGAVCVTGSLNTVSRARAWGKARGYGLAE